MTEDKFFKLVDWRVKTLINLLTSKGNEYSKKENKLHNFDRASEKSGQIREKVIKNFMLKHEISVDDIINNIEEGKLPTKVLVQEKVGDIIAYYILLEASIYDRIDRDKEVNG